MGDLSPKGRVGDSRLDPVFGRQSNSKQLGNTNCRLNTGSELPCGNVMFRRNITHLLSE
ncbi:MAG: hypothetical protein LBI18_01580 [Planctomycetaceae bacterium]|nr:hypothetical protein [Planctomycetaceae bacterium]